MNELTLAVAMAFVLEGLFYALFPKLAQNMMKEMSNLSEERFRNIGLVTAILGVGLVFIIRN